MKNFRKITLGALLATVTIIGFYSCNSDNNETGVNSNSTEEISVKTNSVNLVYVSTDLITEDLLDLGVSGINVNNHEISFNTFNDYYFHDQIVNFSNYIVKEGDNYLSLDNSKIVINADNFVYYKGGQEIDLNNYNALDEKDLVLLCTYVEFKASSDTKMTLAQYEAKGRTKPCPIYNIRRAVGWGATPDEAASDLWYATYEFAKEHMGDGCYSIGGVNKKTIGALGFEIDLAIQSFCCP